MISKKDFMSGKFPKLKSNLSTLEKHRIYKFLQVHKDQAFTAREIEKKVKKGKKNVRNILRQLTVAKMVLHKDHFYSIA